MKQEEQKQLVANEGWREFRDWVKASVELESKRVNARLEYYDLEGSIARRDAFEDVWGMIKAFEKPMGNPVRIEEVEKGQN